MPFFAYQTLIITHDKSVSVKKFREFAMHDHMVFFLHGMQTVKAGGIGIAGKKYNTGSLSVQTAYRCARSEIPLQYVP